ADKVLLRGPLPGQVVTVAEAKHGLKAIAEKYSAGAAMRYASDIGKARDAAQVLPRPVVVEDALVSASSSAAWDIVRSVSLARKWVTQKDPAVCQTCAGRDEKFDDGWELPAHPRCRCYWRPHASPDRHVSPAFWRDARRWHIITNPMR
ncbi:MAG: hypothetical protein KGL42_15090, partial [Betaproteobacteria bacterium]|nr:hypothetical protein [Betaproteobacteria bacterium]